MTTYGRPAAQPVVLDPVDLAGTARLLLVAALAGIALGVGDLVWMAHVPYPWASLANSSAVWAVSAFVLGAALRTGPVRAAVAGVVMMLVAVEAYYGWAAFTDRGGVATMWSTTAQMWLVFGVFAGALFGVAGAWTTGPGRVWWQQVVGAAVGAGVLLGEALHTVLHLQGAADRHEVAQTAVAMAALGVVVLLVTCRRPALLVTATLAAVPTAVFSAAAFSALGITY